MALVVRKGGNNFDGKKSLTPDSVVTGHESMARQSNEIDDRSDPQWFATTHWSMVSPADAQDLTQAFFAKLLQKNFWARADPQKGRFRSFLLTALRQFLADERDRVRTAKRGGGLCFISIDEQTGEERLLEGMSRSPNGEQQFDRQWAATVLLQARAKLRQECIAAGKSGLYNGVSVVDGKNESSLPYAVIAQELGMSVGALKSAVSRLRQRYGQLVREEVAHTVSSPCEIEAEIRHLLAVIGD